jgi:aminoglycoside 6'-N-acetyltransferase I
MVIQRLEQGDFTEWQRMRLALWPDNTVQELHAEMEEIMEDSAQDVFVMVRADGRLGGFVEVSTRDYADGCKTRPVGYIEGWYVDPELRELGYGASLVGAAENWARAAGCQEMASDCLIDNEVSLGAHLAIGYEEVERLIHFRKAL